MSRILISAPVPLPVIKMKLFFNHVSNWTGDLFSRNIQLWKNLMNTRLATITLTAFLLLAQTLTAQITVPDRFVQIRSVNLTTSVLELFNSGTSSQSLAGWRFCTHDEDSVRRYSSTTGLNLSLIHI